MNYKHHVPSLERLICELKKWPGVGPRSANRLAGWLIKQPITDIEKLRLALLEIKTRIHQCSNCFTLTEEKTMCHLCQLNRKKDTICVVEEPFDIARVEASGKFKGQYHVLHGTLSPLNKKTANDLTIDSLINKIKNKDIIEIILAVDANMEGDMTALYLTKIIKEHNSNIKICRLAHGIPMGSDIDYIDEQTLGRALENRVEL